MEDDALHWKGEMGKSSYSENGRFGEPISSSHRAPPKTALFGEGASAMVTTKGRE